MDYLKVLVYISIFLIGFFSYTLLAFSEIETPLFLGSLGLNSKNAEAPGDWIKENQIHIYDNAVIIDVEDASIGKYAPTGSMLPVLDKESNGIRIVPENPEQYKIPWHDIL